MMTEQPLQKALCRYFSDTRLNSRQLRTLSVMAKAHGISDGFLRRHRVAASLLAAVTMTAVILLGIDVNRSGGADIYQRVAEEVVGNHLKLRPLDVATEDFSVLRQFFTKLDFVPVNSVLFEGSSWKLLGGRYCSVQGREAAQLRMSSPAGLVRTLYEVPYDRVLYAGLPDVRQGERPSEVYARGMKVQLWRERGLLFVTVSEQADM